MADLPVGVRQKGLSPPLNELKTILGRLEAVQAHAAMFPYKPLLSRIQQLLHQIIARETMEERLQPGRDLSQMNTGVQVEGTGLREA